MIEKESNEQTEYDYDVFISYSHDDQEWVQQELLTTLENAGLTTYIDFRDSEVGLPSMINLEHAVERSRHTLVVLTSSWVRSKWTKFESLLAGNTDPSGGQRRLIPVLLESCRIPSRIAMLTYVDFTGRNQPEVAWRQLLKALRAPLREKSVFQSRDDSNLPENLDAIILNILYRYQKQHPGDYKITLKEVTEKSGSNQEDLLQCLYGLREKAWIDYNITAKAEIGLVWLTQLGMKVAK